MMPLVSKREPVMKHYIEPVICGASHTVFLNLTCQSSEDAWCRRNGQCEYVFNATMVGGPHIEDYVGTEESLRAGFVDLLMLDADSVYGDGDYGPDRYSWFYREQAPQRPFRKFWSPRTATEPWQQKGHFREGDAVLYGGGSDWYAMSATADNCANTKYLPGDAYHYRHAKFCNACCNDVLAQRADELRDRLRDYESYPDDARRLANAFLDSMVVVEDGSCCHPDHHLIQPNPALPEWFTEALAGVCLLGSEFPFPGLARCWERFDWPTLIAEHQEFLVPDVNKTASWAGICAAFHYLKGQGYEPILDVNILASDTEAKLLVWPTMLYVTELKEPDDDVETIGAIDGILRAAGDGSGGGHQILRDREGKPEYVHWDVGCCA